jgi:hypothetical protein
MADQQVPRYPEATDRQAVDCGGLRFEATLQAPAGATLGVFGEVDGEIAELLRFDDFIEGPHYHIPATGDPAPSMRACWASHSPGSSPSYAIILLSSSTRRGSLGPALTFVDLDDVTEHAEDVRKAMEACVPDGYVRVPGVGLRRSLA